MDFDYSRVYTYYTHFAEYIEEHIYIAPQQRARVPQRFLFSRRSLPHTEAAQARQDSPQGGFFRGVAKRGLRHQTLVIPVHPGD